MKLITSFLLFFLLLQPANAQYKNKYIIEAFKQFKLTRYQKSLAELKKVRGNSRVMGIRYYLEGIILNRLQEYDKAIISFKKSLKRGHKSDDLYYELAQAQYANSELIISRKNFLKSYESNFKKESSLYYCAYISQLLEEYKLAKKYYVKLIKETKDDKRLQQVARFQLAESFLSMVENQDDPARLVSKYIIPNMDEAYETLPKGDLAKDIKNRKKEILKKYGLDPNIMKNGKNLGEDRLAISLKHKYSYDSNITLETDQTTNPISQKDSMIHSTTFNIQRLYSAAGRFTFTPYMRLKNVFHTNREEPTVHQNDSQNLAVGSRNTHEHTLFGAQASFQFNYEHNYGRRDRNQNKDVRFFSRTNQFSIGEQFRYFSMGPTTVSIEHKDYKAWTRTLDFRNLAFSINQIIASKNGYLYNVLLRTDRLDTYNNPGTISDSYLFSLAHIYPEIFPSYTLTSSLSLTHLIPKNARDTRGVERTIAPSIEMSKLVSKNVSASFGYDFTRNISKNKQSFDYKKHVVRFQLSANF